MMGQKTPVLTVLALALTVTMSAVFAPGVFAQGMRTATGQNPLERISGADYAGNGSLGRTNIAPSYSSRAGLQIVRGGADSLGYYWTPQRHGNAVDPRTGVDSLANRNNPFLYPYLRSPGGQLGNGVAPRAPSNTPAAPASSGPAAAVVTVGQSDPSGSMQGIPMPSNTGAYMTNNVGSYYMGGGINNMAYPGGISTPYASNYAVNGMGTTPNAISSGSSYPFGISSYGMASSTYNPYLTTANGLSTASAINAGGAGYGLNGYMNNSASLGYGIGYPSTTRLVPGIVGAAVGALVGRHFGVVGLIAGGIGGFLVGEFLANQATQLPFAGINDNYNAMVNTQYGNTYSYYHGLYDYYGMGGSGKNLGPLPGVAGAVLGAMIGKFGGLPGMLIGGIVGFVGGEVLSHALFPQSTYQQGYYQYDPYNNVGNFRSASLPGSLGSNTATPSATVTPKAPVSSDSLAALQQNYFNALKAAEDAAKSGSDADRKTADSNLKTAESAYRAAQASASGN